MKRRANLKWVGGNVLSWVIIVALTIYGVFVVALYYQQEKIIFPGTSLPADHQFHFDVPYEELNVPVSGAQLNALLFKQPAPRGLVFFIHGNAGNLETWTTGVDYYARVNYDMFIFDYRGYGKSTGQVQSEKQLHADVRQAWDFIAPQYEGKPIVIYGRSLGAALAAKLAREVEPELLVLVSSFTSMTAMAKQQYPLLPAWVLRYPLSTDELIGDIRSPTIFVHGSDDRFIDVSHSRTLHSLMQVPAALLVVEGADHNDIHNFKTYLDGLTDALPD